MARRFKCRFKRPNGRFTNHEGVGPDVATARHELIRSAKRASGQRLDLRGLELAFWVQEAPGRPWYRLPTPPPVKRTRPARRRA